MPTCYCRGLCSVYLKCEVHLHYILSKTQSDLNTICSPVKGFINVLKEEDALSSAASRSVWQSDVKKVTHLTLIFKKTFIQNTTGNSSK